MSKETYIYEKRPPKATHKRDSKKRPTKVLFVRECEWKSPAQVFHLSKKTYIYEKRPTKETHKSSVCKRMWMEESCTGLPLVKKDVYLRKETYKRDPQKSPTPQLTVATRWWPFKSISGGVGRVCTSFLRVSFVGHFYRSLFIDIHLFWIWERQQRNSMTIFHERITFVQTITF